MRKYFNLISSLLLLVALLLLVVFFVIIFSNTLTKTNKGVMNEDLTTKQNLDVTALKQKILNSDDSISDVELATKIRIKIGENLAVIDGMRESVLLEALDYEEVYIQNNYFND